MTTTNSSANSGVHGSTGYEFQKHCALYVLLEQYSTLKNNRYFICLEHHEDFLFCFLTAADLVRSVDSYQAKKASENWGLSAELFDILHKMTNVGIALDIDTMPKDSTYDHSLNFISNHDIKLSIKQKGKLAISDTVNVSREKVLFTSLKPEIAKKIRDEINVLSGSSLINDSQLTKMSFGFIDLNKSYTKQKQTLIGQFNLLFGKTVADHSAAVETLLRLFRNAENVLNQGGIVQLMDKSKRVDYKEINKAIDVITKEQKAYEFWRSKSDEISKKILISLAEKTKFELAFKNSFDLFKDNKQVEHQKILKFVNKNRDAFDIHTSDVDCLEELYNRFMNQQNTQLKPIDIKATLFAAYIEILDTL
ncbi:dsDNA nuclease domain-containing protein [Pedobacter cryoconitis]|uniref:dsDNA nuclease domain-containing protein n=1 Tax=Pedobacter cryoconitis TaxID=188932 RepID=UPI00161F80ED|nr:dsDNA nuclease domain-containing protein [Pedobacter cryoconitis]MBB5645738.1 hypothetical protein [Pedobacter cryoconitis]